MNSNHVIVDREILGGTPVFAGSRVPGRLGSLLVGYAVNSVQRMGWAGIKNGPRKLVFYLGAVSIPQQPIRSFQRSATGSR